MPAVPAVRSCTRTRRATVSPMPVRSRTATVGRRAPDFTLADQDGNEFHLTDAVAEGPVVLVFLRGFG